MHTNDRGSKQNIAGELGEILLELLTAMSVSNNKSVSLNLRPAKIATSSPYRENSERHFTVIIIH